MWETEESEGGQELIQIFLDEITRQGMVERYRREKFTLGNREDGKKLNEKAPRHPHP